MATEETEITENQNDTETENLSDEPVIVNFDPSIDNQPQQIPPPIPSDVNPNKNEIESKQNEEYKTPRPPARRRTNTDQERKTDANNEDENDENLEVDYDNPISIPPAVPTDSVRDLMFDTYSIPQKPGPNISAMIHNNNTNASLFC